MKKYTREELEKMSDEELRQIVTDVNVQLARQANISFIEEFFLEN